MRQMAMLILITGSAAGLLAGQQPAASPDNRLISGKLMYVGQMPEGLTGWIMQDLKDWGRYKPTGNSEGVDLVMKSYRPPKRAGRERRQVILYPHQPPRPSGQEREDERDSLAVIDVTDWITGDVLWSASIVNKKPKNVEAPATAQITRIYSHGLSNERLAARITDALRAYVESLSPSGAPTIPPLRHSPN